MRRYNLYLQTRCGCTNVLRDFPLVGDTFKVPLPVREFEGLDDGNVPVRYSTVECGDFKIVNRRGDNAWLDEV
jgi:hypothetical protein